MLARSILAVFFSAFGVGAAVAAEVREVRFARQLGLGYLQFYIMQDLKLVEINARELGLGEIATEWRPIATPTALTDALLSDNADVLGLGLPPSLTLWDRTRGEVKAVAALNAQPAFLNTRIAGVRSLRDFTDNDRIALPAPKVSVQAIMLQMMAEKTFGSGKHDMLDKLTVGMSHPEGTTALLSGKLEITGHFTPAPFQYQQLENRAIHKVASSYEATDGPNTFTLMVLKSRWRDANPQTYQAIVKALFQANEFIAKNPQDAARIFVKIEGTKLLSR